jgi:hypothetical protein
MQDVLFALELIDSELRDRPKAEPDLPEERNELRYTSRPEAVSKFVVPRSP